MRKSDQDQLRELEQQLRLVLSRVPADDQGFTPLRTAVWWLDQAIRSTRVTKDPEPEHAAAASPQPLPRTATGSVAPPRTKSKPPGSAA